MRGKPYRMEEYVCRVCEGHYFFRVDGKVICNQKGCNANNTLDIAKKSKNGE